jgi:hypothetical protein
MDEIISTILSLIPVALFIGIRVLAAKKKSAGTANRQSGTLQKNPRSSGELSGILAKFFQEDKEEETPAVRVPGYPLARPVQDDDEGFSAHRLSVDEDDGARARQLAALRAKADAYTREEEAKKKTALAASHQVLSRPLSEASEAPRTAAQLRYDIEASYEKDRSDRQEADNTGTYRAKPVAAGAAATASATVPPPKRSSEDIQSSVEKAQSHRSLEERLAGLSPLAQGVIMSELLGAPLALRNSQ